MTTDLTRPIVGIENRTAQEVFDIMCDRVRIALPHLGQPVCWRIDETMKGGSIQWRTVEHQHHAMQIAAESVFPAECYPLFRAPPAPAVAIKPLEWDMSVPCPDAECVLGHYVIDPRSARVELVAGYGMFSTICVERIQLDFGSTVEALISAAQADYEARIRSALVFSAPVSPDADLMDRMAKALEPFASFAEFAADEAGWVDSYGKERINNWMGPSDFIAARAVLADYKAMHEPKTEVDTAHD